MADLFLFSKKYLNELIMSFLIESCRYYSTQFFVKSSSNFDIKLKLSNNFEFEFESKLEI